MAANQAPSAAACVSPSWLNGTSTSRTSSAMRSSPADMAASRATLPALWPWRTIQSVAGQRDGEGARSMRGFKRPPQRFGSGRLTTTLPRASVGGRQWGMEMSEVRRSHALVIGASSVGTVFEWYDFYLY